MKWLIFFAVFTSASFWGIAQTDRYHHYFAADGFSPLPIPVEGETYIMLPQMKKIKSDGVPLEFKINGGSFRIRINGMIDKISASPVVFSITAEELSNNRLNIFLIQGGQYIRYEAKGTGFGFYAGAYEASGNFIARTKFKITAPGYADYIVDFPIRVQLSPSGNLYFGASCDDEVSLYRSGKNKTIKNLAKRQ